jgi:hypothetical protein
MQLVHFGPLCQGTPVVALARTHQYVHPRDAGTLTRILLAAPIQRQAISDIYTRDHRRYYLLIVTLMA